MPHQQNHLFVDEPTIKNINKLILKHYHQIFRFTVAHPPISWLKSQVNLFPQTISSSHSHHYHQHHQIETPTVTQSKTIAHFNSKKITSVDKKRFSFLYRLSSSSIKLTLLFCLFISLYLFSSTIYLYYTSLPTLSPSSTSFYPSSSNSVHQIKMTSDSCKKAFDVDKVCHCLQKYNEDIAALNLDLYIEAYKELQKFFYCLGTIFSFVTSDVESKISILENYRNDPTYGEEYKTLQSMIEYEAKNNLLKSEERPSGARTLLRLHRALEFISRFILEVSKLEDAVATGPAARSVYQTTLAKYHPWVIRQTASFAMYGLPNRDQLQIRVFGDEPGDNKDKFTQKMITLAELSETAYNVTNKLYEDNNLLDLP